MWRLLWLMKQKGRCRKRSLSILEIFLPVTLGFSIFMFKVSRQNVYVFDPVCWYVFTITHFERIYACLLSLVWILCHYKPISIFVILYRWLHQHGDHAKLIRMILGGGYELQNFFCDFSHINRTNCCKTVPCLINTRWFRMDHFLGHTHMLHNDEMWYVKLK